jgi:hypothetical protein
MIARGPKPVRIKLSREQRSQLEQLALATASPVLALRSRIVLGCAGGETHTSLAERLGVSIPTIATWRQRFAAQGVDGLADRARWPRQSASSPSLARNVDPRLGLQIRVQLLSGGNLELDPPPGRLFLVGPEHTFAQLAEAINLGFARWDTEIGYEFELPYGDGRLIGIPDDSGPTDTAILDPTTLKVTEEVNPGDRFDAVFDYDMNWYHEISVDGMTAPDQQTATMSKLPMVIQGWGMIPDPYGRRSWSDVREDL